VVEALAAGGVKVAAASRTPEAGQDAGRGVVPVRFDWADRATWAPALRDAEALYIVGAYAHPTGERLVGELLAEAPDTRRVVVLSVIGAEQVPPEAMMSPWERAVRTSGKDWTMLHPNWFFQNFRTGFAPDDHRPARPVPAHPRRRERRGDRRRRARHRQAAAQLRRLRRRARRHLAHPLMN
jgi:uncharacterized protein YbjT (DUF2867 family)